MAPKSDLFFHFKEIRIPVLFNMRAASALAAFMTMMVSLVSARQMERIFNGKNATQGQFPYQVSWLKCKHSYGDYGGYYNSYCFNFCGGSIFNKTTIITAGHCCYDKWYLQNELENSKIVAGDINLQSESGLKQVRKIKSHIIYPHYDTMGHNVNDICLLTLESPLDFNKYVNSINLDRNKPVVGSKCQVSGWGRQDGV